MQTQKTIRKQIAEQLSGIKSEIGFIQQHIPPYDHNTQ
jgi:hypothetical protein